MKALLLLLFLALPKYISKNPSYDNSLSNGITHRSNGQILLPGEPETPNSRLLKIGTESFINAFKFSRPYIGDPKLKRPRRRLHGASKSGDISSKEAIAIAIGSFTIGFCLGVLGHKYYPTLQRWFNGRTNNSSDVVDEDENAPFVDEENESNNDYQDENPSQLYVDSKMIGKKQSNVKNILEEIEKIPENYKEYPIIPSSVKWIPWENWNVYTSVKFSPYDSKVRVTIAPLQNENWTANQPPSLDVDLDLDVDVDDEEKVDQLPKSVEWRNHYSQKLIYLIRNEECHYIIRVDMQCMALGSGHIAIIKLIKHKEANSSRIMKKTYELIVLPIDFKDTQEKRKMTHIDLLTDQGKNNKGIDIEGIDDDWMEMKFSLNGKYIAIYDKNNVKVVRLGTYEKESTQGNLSQLQKEAENEFQIKIQKLPLEIICSFTIKERLASIHWQANSQSIFCLSEGIEGVFYRVDLPLSQQQGSPPKLNRILTTRDNIFHKKRAKDFFLHPDGDTIIFLPLSSCQPNSPYWYSYKKKGKKQAHKSFEEGFNYDGLRMSTDGDYFAVHGNHTDGDSLIILNKEMKEIKRIIQYRFDPVSALMKDQAFQYELNYGWKTDEMHGLYIDVRKAQSEKIRRYENLELEYNPLEYNEQ